MGLLTGIIKLCRHLAEHADLRYQWSLMDPSGGCEPFVCSGCCLLCIPCLLKVAFCFGPTYVALQVGMTPDQASLYKAAVQKVRDEVMAAVEAANAANSGGSAAGR